MSRFKIGDKVRIREDLIISKDYDCFAFGAYMKKYENKIATIVNKIENHYYILNIDNGYNAWTDGMLEPVQEETIEYKGKKYDVLGEYGMDEDSIKMPYGTELRIYLTEHKEEILDETEKRYLRNVIKYVIKPTKDKIENIAKTKCMYNKFYILIRFKNSASMPLPVFYNKKMYAGMKDNEPYTLEQLGLEKNND